MARSKGKFRAKKTGSCPCVPDGKDGDSKDLTATGRVTPPETRFTLQDFYNNPNDEYVDLESYSEVSSVTALADPITPGGTGTAETIAGVGDQAEESIFLSAGTTSSVQPEDSEPNEETAAEEENRKLNIAATVMSWLDNYGQARGYTLGSHGTSLMIQPDELSRRGSGGSINDIDEVDATSTRSRTVALATENNLRKVTKEDTMTLETACSILINCHNDLDPLKETSHGLLWKKIQEVLYTWFNLLSTIWTRSQMDHGITRTELFSYVSFSSSLESLALAVSPVDTTNFINPVIRNNLSRIQSLISLTLKYCKDIQATERIEEAIVGITSWADAIKPVSSAAIEHVRKGSKTTAEAIIANQTAQSKIPRYEIVLHDVIPTKTACGWVFFGTVALKHLPYKDSNNETDQVIVRAQESSLHVIFMASTSREVPCIDFASIFHIVCRASLECAQYYRHATEDFARAKLSLQQSLLPESYPKAFAHTTPFGQYTMMEMVVAQIVADQCIEPTVTAIDEILRSFSVLVVLVTKILRKFVKNVRIEVETTASEHPADIPFTELTVPMATDANTLVFQTVRRFLSLGPLSFTSSTGVEDIEKGKSSLNAVHDCLETGINQLYGISQRNVFSFHHGIQSLFAISQLISADEFLHSGGGLEKPMKSLVLERLSELSSANTKARETFKTIVRSLDDHIKTMEGIIDKIMRKGAALGVMLPVRTSGVSFSHRHGRYILIRYRRNSYIRHQAKRLRQSHELHRHTRKYVVEPDSSCETETAERKSDIGVNAESLGLGREMR